MTTIYYYSATGNSYAVARDIARKIDGAQLSSLVPLASGTTAAGDGVVGIVFPVYDWSIPPVVRDSLEGLNVSRAEYIFAVATCNFLPGCALDRINQMLAAKGKALNAGFVVKMPGTYLPMYGANTPGLQARKLRAKDKKTGRIARIVSERRDRRSEGSPLLFDRLLGPKMEKCMEIFPEKDRDFTLESSCTGCGICARVCPFGNIEMIGKEPQWLHHCQQCFACAHLCPQQSIQIGDKTKDRKRYQNPAVPLKEIIAMASESRDAHTGGEMQP